MSFIAKNSGSGDFEMTPEGTYIGRCFKMIDMGTQETTGIYGTKAQHKVMVTWELLDDDVKMADGRPFAVSKWYTVSLHEKAQLRKDLEAWRGKKFSDEELDGFDLSVVVGTYCMIQVIHSTDGKYANINAIMAYKGAQPKGVNPNVVFDIDNPDMTVFKNLSDNLKDKIMATPEWEKRNTGGTAAPDLADPFAKKPAASEADPEMPDDFLKQDEVAEVTDEELNHPKLPDAAPTKAGK